MRGPFFVSRNALNEYFWPLRILNMKKQWFESWFDSPYYHLLYANRDYKEAEEFITNIIAFLKPESDAHLLDLGCGKGRHSLFLSNMDLKVTGLDLSENSIKSLEHHNSNRLHFEQWDMRQPYKASHFDVVLNLFTSFGYFEDNEENIDVLKAVNYNLKDNGILLLDFLNENVVRKNINLEEVIKRGEVEFQISKKEDKDYVVKTISFSDDNENYQFEERVKLISKNSFEDMFEKSGFIIENIFGDYQLNPFDSETSKRIIFIVRKKKSL